MKINWKVLDISTRWKYMVSFMTWHLHFGERSLSNPLPPYRSLSPGVSLYTKKEKFLLL
jgi:hypothetical protein